MEQITQIERVLFGSGLQYKGNKVIDDFLLTGKPDVVRDLYKCCQEDIAEQMVGWAELNDDHSILEPGAGKGCILKKIAHFTDHWFCEINMQFVIHELSKISKNFEGVNFFDVQRKFDRVVMNPPFAHKEYVKHIYHGYECLEQNGIMVFLYPKNAEFLKIENAEFIEFLEQAEKREVGKVCGECECVIGKITKL